MNGRRCRPWSRVGLIGLLASVLVAVSAQGAAATESSASATDELADAVVAVAPAESVVAVDESADDGLTAAVDGADLSVPVDGGDALTVATDEGAEFQLGLPAAADGVEAQVASDGSVVYESNEAVDVVAQVLDDGVRVTTVIADDSAPVTYDYSIDGAVPALQPDGTVILTDAADPNGEPVGLVEAPWAKDATGKDVPTRYVVEGATLVQHVDHQSGDYEYPVVADPKYTFGWRSIKVKFSSAETNWIANTSVTAAGLECARKFKNIYATPLCLAIIVGSKALANKAKKNKQCLVGNIRVIGLTPVGAPWIEKC